MAFDALTVNGSIDSETRNTMSAAANLRASDGLMMNVCGEALPPTSNSGVPVSPITWTTSAWMGFIVTSTLVSA